MLLRDLLHDRTGIYFEPDRLDLLMDKLEPRVRACGFSSYLDYYYLLKYEPKADAEWRNVMDTLSVQETYFWREFSQIQVLTDQIAPEWFRRTTEPLRIWSAACASGEEPYTIAIALREAGFTDRPISIFASDASGQALEKARAGVYRERSFRALPPALREKYFEPVAEGWRLRKDMIPPVHFLRANIASPRDISTLAAVPVIFCRNVFIYFSPDAIRKTVAAFAAFMPLGGHLFVGASESLLKLTRDFELQEARDAFVYVKTPRRR